MEMMEEDDREREREEREIIQLRRICSRSQMICICKEQKRRKKQGEKEKNCKEGKTRGGYRRRKPVIQVRGKGIDRRGKEKTSDRGEEGREEGR